MPKHRATVLIYLFKHLANHFIHLISYLIFSQKSLSLAVYLALVKIINDNAVCRNSSMVYRTIYVASYAYSTITQLKFQSEHSKNITLVNNINGRHSDHVYMYAVIY